MKNLDRIDIIISKIDWSNIRKYHKKLDIFWEIENEKKEKVLRIPTEKDLKEDLLSILHYMFNEKMEYLSYGNWIIFWNMDSIVEEERLLSEIRVIFRVSDYTFTNNQDLSKQFQKSLTEIDKVKLEIMLENALKVEDYENAAFIRDRIFKLKSEKI